MRVLTWNLALGTWLIISCFALRQSAPSIIVTYSASVIVLACSIAALGRPWVRYFVSVTALVLAACAILLPDMSWGARVSDLITAALLFALSVVSPRKARWDENETEVVEPPHRAHAVPHGAHGVTHGAH